MCARCPPHARQAQKQQITGKHQQRPHPGLDQQWRCLIASNLFVLPYFVFRREFRRTNPTSEVKAIEASAPSYLSLKAIRLAEANASRRATSMSYYCCSKSSTNSFVLSSTFTLEQIGRVHLKTSQQRRMIFRYHSGEQAKRELDNWNTQPLFVYESRPGTR